ncbi:MAG: chlorophyll synthase ChlG [Aestuariivirga sp.]|uniref:chlorophyll synthase ChlG n=1 Tax=Aestuariivirga sp. TaxID=2650926 RepID=UPI0025BF8AA5|nr:chlorophyll synthase ChlG [Aestuariivirga sp.]MCA3559677.1 chlorophyll synthase ChlG [Aestuariivirga sp.]
MANLASTRTAPSLPQAAAVVRLLKPVTWFPPMWAFACGAVSSGVSLGDRWGLVLAGMALSGPLVCGASQAVNDWFDRHVDAINEPGRPIPSGRVPGRWGLYIAIIWTAVSLAVALALGPVVFWAASFGMAMAWAYSAPPFRLKANGWWGNAAVGLCYEGLPWFTGAAVLLAGVPGWPIVTLALLYSAGAHGIMTLNDFKAIEGDTRMGVRSLPVQLGVEGAARTACAVMALPQLAVIGLLFFWGKPLHAAAVLGLLAVQLVMMRRFLAQPVQRALWYSGLGVTLYVSGMMVSAFALRALA